jgi:hypothetical protein
MIEYHYTFMTEYSTILCTMFSYPFISWRTFRMFLFLVSSALVNTEVQMSLEHTDFISYRYIPSSGIAGTYSGSIFNFLRTRNTVSIMAELIYIPINSVLGFPILHILANSCYFRFLDNRLSNKQSDISLRFPFAFPWVFVILSICFYIPVGFCLSTFKKCLLQSFPICRHW